MTRTFARKLGSGLCNQVLLAADAGSSAESIAVNVAISTSTIYRTKQRFVEEGLEEALSEEPRCGAERKLSAPEEALLIATACTKPPEGRAIRNVKASGAYDLFKITGTPAGTAKVGKTYRATIQVSTPEDASIAIVAGPPGLEWKGSDLVWEVPADFPGGPVPVVVTATQSSGHAASFGFLIDVQE